MLRGRGRAPRVKICGITGWADAKLSVDAGADALGFNFYPPSPRYIAPRQAARIVRRLHSERPRARITIVGVFVDEAVETIREIAEMVGLDAVQLHGRETPSRVAEVAAFRPVIKVFRVRPGFSPSRLARYPAAAAFLLDGFQPGLPGGTGRRFDWSVARRAARYGRIFLAGGLRPENAAEAIAQARPFALDVCSGVETRPGRKDPAKVKEFMRQVVRARRQRR
jgi:phosphoribosylanthranilate isomerase